MRDRLPKFDPQGWQHVPSHFGLAYDAWAPIDGDGKIPTSPANFRDSWLAKLPGASAGNGDPIDPDYEKAFNRWHGSFGRHDRPDWHDRRGTLALSGRLLIGHGNPSGTEVGLTVHHTWGVPVIPGSALKGLCAHYAAATYGKDDSSNGAGFRGPGWDDQRRRVIVPPGEYYRVLFGAPDVSNDAGRHDGSGGEVVFHDALYVPGSSGGRPYVVDVLTPHQSSYYNEENRWPNDYDNPNPIGFMTVKKGTKVHVVLSGDREWTQLAMDLLTEAMNAWGIGGKTTGAGYGRGSLVADI